MSPETNEWVGLLWTATEKLYANGAVMRDQAGRCVFRLLVLKFLSDVSEGPTTPGLPQFVVPSQAHWSQLRHPESWRVVDLLHSACTLLEDANPSLRELLSTTDFNPAGMSNSALVELIETLSALPPLRGELVSDGKLGEVADSFLRRLVEAGGRGFIHTPPSVTRLLAEVLEPKEDSRVCDPVCGVGGLLVGCVRQIASSSRLSLPIAATRLALYGQERNAEIWALCRLNLLLHGITGAHVELGNVLWSPPVEQGQLFKYDRILANPPWTLSNWGVEQAAYDAFGRFNPIPPKNNADYAFVQHCLAALEEGGRAVLLLPRGVLLRSGSEGLIRRKLLEEDRFEAIIALPGGLLHGTGLAPVILVLSKGKSPKRRKHVLFIDASGVGVKQGRVLRTLSQDDIGSIAKSFQSFEGDPRYVHVAHLEEIRAHNWNLTVERYVEREEQRERFDLEDHLDTLANTESQRDEAARRMDDAVSRLKRFYLPDS
ncbi:MAG TPA: N-6 DNA methylase [Myxococcaceae bacterium]|nr:N-6 DNA methylase [Myxococcaceae bacterium]